MRVLQVTPFTVNELSEVTRIHLEAFPDYRSTLLGRIYVQRVYKWMLEAPEAFAFIAHRSGEVAGFVAGASDNYNKEQARALWPWFAVGILSRPWLLLHSTMRFAIRYRLKNLFHRPARNSSDDEYDGTTSILLSIAVSTRFQGKGIAGDLIACFEQEAVRRGCDRVRLSVRKRNESACRAYDKAGWQRTEDTRLPGAFIYSKAIRVRVSASGTPPASKLPELSATDLHS